jgi:GNAT superfamily N-acetyltransferase
LDSPPADTQSVRSLGHVALHYRNPDEGPLAAKLLTKLGFVETQGFPLPQGGHFYRFVVDPKHRERGDGIVFLSPVPPAQKALIEAARQALKVGAPDQHPAVGALREAMAADPEYSFHVGVLLASLEELERTVLALQQDEELKPRIKVRLNRARPGDAAVDARLDASPLYAQVSRYAYGRNGVQAFVETDLLSSGVLGESLVIELDYVFPNAGSHILAAVEM